MLELNAERQSDIPAQRIFDAAPNALLVVGPDHRIVEANHQAEKLLGYERRELIGLSVEALVPIAARATHVQQVDDYLSAPHPRTLGRGPDMVALRRDGSSVPVEIGLSPLESGPGSSVLVSIVDVTERRRVQDELRRSNESLEQFAYAASHDLQEPLRAVIGCLGILERRYRDQLDPEAQTLVRHAVEGSERMRALIEGLLQFARVGTSPLPAATASGDEALDRALANLATAIAENGVTIVRQPLPPLRIAPTQLTLVLQNLLANAIKFRGPAPPHVRVDVEDAGHEWVITVADNGIGIAPGDLERIFAVFQRLHTRREYPGHGLGLTLARRIATHHGGRLWAESQLGNGSRFRLALPKAADRAP